MKFQRLLITSLFVVAVSSMSFAGIINPISASVAMGVSADADPSCGSVANAGGQSWGTPLTTLATSASVLSACGNKNITAEGQVTANWSNNTKNGNIKFKNVGWNSNRRVTAASADAGLATDYLYTFSNNTNSTIQMDLNYLTSFTGDLNGFGLNGFYVSLSGIWNTVLVGISNSGTMTAFLAPFQTYTLTIENGANIGGLAGNIKEMLDGKFDFHFTPVPEPSSMLLMGSGILALAGALRKKMNG